MQVTITKTNQELIISNCNLECDRQIMSDAVFHSTQICLNTNWKIVTDEEIGYTYAYYGNNWVSYDDVKVATTKVSLYSHTSHNPLTCYEVCTKRIKGSFKHSDKPRISETFTKQLGFKCVPV